MLCCWLLPQCSLFGPNHRFVDLIVWLFLLCHYFVQIHLAVVLFYSWCVATHTHGHIDRYTIFENHKADREKRLIYSNRVQYFWTFLLVFYVFSSIFYSHKAQSITYRVTTATTTTKLRLQPTKTVDINKIN